MSDIERPAELFAPDPRAFPTLTARQADRILQHGRRRGVSAGEALIQPGDRGAPFFVVLRGTLEVVRGSGAKQVIELTPKNAYTRSKSF